MSEELTQEPAQESTDPSMQLNDLVIALESLQLASSRGAFRPEEFTTVGGCYERIYSFLAASGAIKLPNQNEEGNQS